MSSPPPCILYRINHAESSSFITEEGINAGYATCRGLGNYSIIHPYRFNHHMNRNNKEVPTCYISTTDSLIWALLIALKYRHEGKRDIFLVMIDVDKALQCGDIIFHAQDLGRSFGHADCAKWVWEYLFHTRISGPAVVGHVSLNDLLNRGLYEILSAFSRITTMTRLAQLRESVMLDFSLMREHQDNHTWNPDKKSWDWREWFDTG